MLVTILALMCVGAVLCLGTLLLIFWEFGAF